MCGPDSGTARLDELQNSVRGDTEGSSVVQNLNARGKMQDRTHWHSNVLDTKNPKNLPGDKEQEG